MKDETPVAKSI